MFDPINTAILATTAVTLAYLVLCVTVGTRRLNRNLSAAHLSAPARPAPFRRVYTAVGSNVLSREWIRPDNARRPAEQPWRIEP